MKPNLPLQRRRALQVDAAVALLQTFTDEQLRDVLARLGNRGVVLEQPDPQAIRICGVCGFSYANCRRRALASGDDHDFEPITKSI